MEFFFINFVLNFRKKIFLDGGSNSLVPPTGVVDNTVNNRDTPENKSNNSTNQRQDYQLKLNK